MNTIDEIKNKYENQSVEVEEPNENKLQVTKTVTGNSVRVGLGLSKPPKKRYILGDVFGKDYEINHNQEVFQTLQTIGTAMTNLKGNDRISKLYGMLRDMFYVIFVNKEDADEVLAINSEFEIEEQMQNLQLIVKAAIAVMTNKSLDDIDKLVNSQEVDEESETFRKEEK